MKYWRYSVECKIKAFMLISIELILTQQDDEAPLHAAAATGNVTAIKALLEAGADPNIRTNEVGLAFLVERHNIKIFENFSNRLFWNWK